MFKILRKEETIRQNTINFRDYREEDSMKITHETRRESFEQLDPSGRKAAILTELERGDGTALEIMRRMGFTDPNRVRPRLNELDRAGYIFQIGKRRDPYTGVEGVIYGCFRRENHCTEH